MAGTLQRIRLLPDQVKSKIAAGEVIEGPFSVVKELIENSIDAGPSSIEVQVFESGFRKIVVRDDGCGIHPADIGLAVKEHATSKIGDIDDIGRISSYGFRGEALSSVSSVAEVAILSRPPDEEIGARLSVSEQGVSVTDYAGPHGTTVIVENLFYNIPARKKFMKSPRAEARLIREMFLKIALVNPGIAFSLESDGKRVITLGADRDLAARVERIYGKEISSGLYEEELADIKVRMRAFLSKPDSLRSSRGMQALYVNGRPVEYRYFSFLLSRAYEAVATPGRYPAALVFIEIDPSLVDVNIHPAKREVKLFDQRYIDSLIMAVAEKALNREHRITGSTLSADAPFPGNECRQADGKESPAEAACLPGIGHAGANERIPANGIESGASFLRDGGPATAAGLYRDTRPEQPGFLGVAFGTYLVVEEGDSLRFIDFHAAHERIIYDSLLDDAAPPETQDLLFPKIVQLPIADYHSIAENLDVFLKIGFDIEEFSDYSIIIRGMPVDIKESGLERMFADFIESLKTDRAGFFTHRERAAASAACHAAKRAGDDLSGEDIRALLELIKAPERELRCPHGRPFVYRLSRGDLERLFKRS